MWLIVGAILVTALMALVAGTALAAEPVVPPVRGFGPGNTTVAPAAGECGAMGAAGMRRGGAPEWAGGSGTVADLLGLTEEELQAARLEGKSLVDIAKDQGVSEDDLIEGMLSAKVDTLAQLVDEGKLTQAQADLMIENMRSRVQTMVERTDVGPAAGQDGARSGMGRGMRGGRWNRQ
jgi:hypothetical protein